MEIVGTKNCGTCRHCPEGEVLRCGKRELGCRVSGRLYVDALYVCPLWRAKRSGIYV